MWLMLNDSFVSIVRKDCPEGHLLVRARRRKDLVALFPDATIIAGGGTDYQYRAAVPIEQVVAAVTERIETVDYPNFKSSVRDPNLHDAYMDVWTVMTRLQNER